MLILSNDEIEKILPVGACLDVLEDAYRDLGNGMAATVPRYDVFSPTKSSNEFYEYKTMSGVLPKPRHRRAPAQLQRGQMVREGGRHTQGQTAGGRRRPLRRADHAVQHRNRRAAGDFSRWLCAETYASPAPARSQRAIWRARIPRRMALLGSGWQASAHLVTMAMIRDLKQVRVFSPTPESRRKFVEEWHGKVTAEVLDSASAAEAIKDADMVICTTNSISALFPGDILEPGMHVSCVKPCELDALTYKRSDPLIIHWREAKPFQIAIGVDPQSIPDVAEGWHHPITREDARSGICRRSRSWSTANIPDALEKMRSVVFVITSALVCSSPP